MEVMFGAQESVQYNYIRMTEEHIDANTKLNSFASKILKTG